jgi:hypothetical protein
VLRGPDELKAKPPPAMLANQFAGGGWVAFALR